MLNCFDNEMSMSTNDGEPIDCWMIKTDQPEKRGTEKKEPKGLK